MAGNTSINKTARFVTAYFAGLSFKNDDFEAYD